MSSAGDFHRAWAEFPLRDLDAIIGGGICLVLAPHPDDESLGCGGLIAACVAAGRPPLVAVLTDGAGSHKSRAYPPERLRAVRAEEVRTAVGCLGLPAERVVFLHQPDTAAPSAGAAFDAGVARLVALIKHQAACTAILAPWRHDPHCDHAAASLAAEAAARVAGVRHVAYPVWGWTLPAGSAVPGSPAAGWRLDVRAFLPAKRRAIQAHRSQYGGLITDDPEGFQLTAEFLLLFDRDFEAFFQP